MNAKHFLPIVPLLMAGCAAQRVEHPIAREIRDTDVSHGVYRIEDRDERMREAVAQARKTVPEFIAALTHPAKGQYDFEVKKPFVKNGDVEHIWLSGVVYDGRRFHGLVDNHPSKITGLNFGDRVSVNPDEITDWAFVDHGKLRGGYTIRCLCRELSPKQRKEFENETKVHIATR